MRVLVAIPVTALLVVVLMPVNDGFYLNVVNYDPQTEDQRWAWRYDQEVMRNTSGYLWGHLLALLTGVWLARRHRYPVALVIAAGTGTAMAAAAFLTAHALGGERLRVGADGRELWEPAAIGEVHHGPLLAAFPLYALLGVGLGVLLTDRLRSRPARAVATAALVIGWLVAGFAGLTQSDRLDIPTPVLWVLPPVAAATAIGMVALSSSGELHPVIAGGWGDAAWSVLIIGLTAWTVVVTGAAVVRTRGHRPARPAPTAPGRSGEP
jgi:hypothetical protein